MDYLSHVKLNHALNRNLALIASMHEGERVVKPEEFVRVYDILLQVGVTVSTMFTKSVIFLYVVFFPPLHVHC